MTKDRTLTLSTLCEVVCAVHLSSYVEAPLPDRGGLMLVAPPGHLKTTALMVLNRHYHNAIAYSALNTQTLTRLREDLGANTVRTIVLPEMQAVYSGDPRTVERLEHTLMQLVAEGHMGASWQDPKYHKFETRATVCGAMPAPFFESRAHSWHERGFLRRFVWAFYRLADPNALTRAIVRWERARINGQIAVPQPPIEGEIPNKVKDAEREELLRMLKYQPSPHEVQLLLLSRALAALRWHYARIGDKRDAMDVMREFGSALGEKAVDLVVG